MNPTSSSFILLLPSAFLLLLPTTVVVAQAFSHYLRLVGLSSPPPLAYLFLVHSSCFTEDYHLQLSPPVLLSKSLPSDEKWMEFLCGGEAIAFLRADSSFGSKSANHAEERDQAGPLLANREVHVAANGVYYMLKLDLNVRMNGSDKRIETMMLVEEKVARETPSKTGSARKASQKPNNSKNPLGDHDSILTIDNNTENDWDSSVYIQSVSKPKPKMLVTYGKVERKMCIKLKEGFGLMKRAMKISEDKMRRRTFRDCQPLEEEALTLKGKDQSTSDWTNPADKNVISILFEQEHRKKEVPAADLSLTIATIGFNHTEFIIEVEMKNYMQVIWKAEKEGKHFTVALEESSMRVEEDMWRIYFSKASNQKGFEVGILLFARHCRNRVEKHYGDSNVLINQMSQRWKVRSEALAPYQAHLIKLTKNFMYITYTHLLRRDN
ncbi:hypothetical protein Cgig2_003839 [Carnegiea gigantea]|uniref:Uncharacterized protein n=1 Tax=Carnegiea gigantea TaxID=171969 RepID=A0A9Q1K6F9_9CARY|nr:hypothetical protein Cgig2_003839 [Carnegiea gigantea]